jgi:hypothetical protein
VAQNSNPTPSNNLTAGLPRIAIITTKTRDRVAQVTRAVILTAATVHSLLYLITTIITMPSVTGCSGYGLCAPGVCAPAPHYSLPTRGG